MCSVSLVRFRRCVGDEHIFYLFRVTLDLNLLKRVLLLKMNEEGTESTKNIKCYTQNFKVEWLNDPEFEDRLEQDKKNEKR